MKLPKARTENLLEQNLEKETLIYDLSIDKAFNLNETLSTIYRACGQNLTFDELKRKNKFTDDFIYLALDELKRENLLAEDYRSPFAKTNRREVVKKVGLMTMLALPLITGLVAPKAARAASGASRVLALLESCTQGMEPYCRNYCIATAGDGDRCCLRESGSGFVYLPGGTYYDPGSAETYYYVASSGPPASTETCDNIITCCDGSAPTGACENIILPPEQQGDPSGTLIAYRKTCSCACP